MIPAWLSFFDALMALALVNVGILGAHFYLLKPFTGFQVFLLGLMVAAFGFLVGLIAIWLSRNPARRSARGRAWLGTLIGLAIIAPATALVYLSPYPPINDITTDFNNPPEFVQAPSPFGHPRDMKYDKAKFAQAQLKGYGPLEPLKLKESPQTVFQHVRIAASDMPEWKVTRTDDGTNTIQGVATTPLFHFHDDFVIQVRSAPGGGSLVEMRSKSRVGKGDFGTNYKRIKSFFAILSSASATPRPSP